VHHNVNVSVTGKKGTPEQHLEAVTEIVHQLTKLSDEGRKIDINQIKTQVSARYGLSDQPKTVDIIAAIPENYKEALLPILKTKPVRTASGVSKPFTSCLYTPYTRTHTSQIDHT
jgi:elongator complex protein 3